MNSPAEPSNFLREAFQALRTSVAPETVARRDLWFDHFLAQGLPTPRQEAWKYTNLAPLQKLSFQRPSAAADLALGALELSALPEADHRWVFLDGSFNAALSRHSLPPSVFSQTALEPDVPCEAPALGALNQAMSTTGIRIRVPAGIRLASPLHFLFVNGSVRCAVFPRIELILEEGAEATVFEEYLGPSDHEGLTLSMLRAWVGAEARLNHIKLQKEGQKHTHLADSTVEIDRAGSLHSLSLSLGGRLGREDLRVRLSGSGAHAKLDGLYMPRRRMHLDHHTEVLHLVPECTSTQNYRGIVDEAGRAVFNGRVYVAKDAQHTDAKQNNANLLLSTEAEIDTKPQLEIFADDVKCSHGASIGALNPNELFYLRSRGLDELSARALVTFAFAARTLRDLEAWPELLKGLRGAVKRALPGAASLDEV